MLKVTDSFTVGDITLYQDAESPDVLYTAPAHLRISINQSGKPVFSIMYFGDRAALMVETLWEVPEAEVESILTAVKERGWANSSRIRMMPVPVNSHSAELRLNEAGQEPVVLAKATPSGFGAMRAVFNAQLDAGQVARVERALRVPDADVVAVYTLEAVSSSRVRIVWVVDVSRTRAVLGERGQEGISGEPSEQQILSLLPELLKTMAIREMVEPAMPPEDQRSKTYRMLAGLLAKHLKMQQQGTLTLSEEDSLPVPIYFHPACSLSQALAGHSIDSFLIGKSHV